MDVAIRVCVMKDCFTLETQALNEIDAGRIAAGHGRGHATYAQLPEGIIEDHPQKRAVEPVVTLARDMAHDVCAVEILVQNAPHQSAILHAANGGATSWRPDAPGARADPRANEAGVEHHAVHRWFPIVKDKSVALHSTREELFKIFMRRPA